AETGGDSDHRICVEIQASHRVGRTGMRRLLFDPGYLPFRVELRDAVPFRIPHPIPEHRRARIAAPGRFEDPRQPLPEQDVIAEHQGHRTASDELTPDYEGPGDAVGRALRSVLERESPIVAGPEQAFEVGKVSRSGDHQDVANA